MKKQILAVVCAAALLVTGCTTAAPSSSSSSVSESSSSSSSSAAESTAPVLPESSSSVAEPVAPAERISLKIAALKGPSAIGLLPLMEHKADTANNYDFTMAGAPDQLVGSIIKGEFDIAVLPTNLAATVFNKTEGKVRLATINTLGVLYLVETGDSVQSIADLKGKTIYSSGKGATPEYALNFVLQQNGLTPGTDVTVEYRTEHTEIATLMASGEATLALLPQPFVTTVLMQNDKARVAIDLTKAWEALPGEVGTLAMSGMVVQQKLIDEHPEALAAFLDEYKVATEYITTPANLDAAAELAVQYEVIPKAAIAKKAIPQCNIVFLAGAEMKTAAEGFLKTLFAANPKSVGGKLPDETFYYIP
ncbi:MAG: ABC transporter substrate-binding protein [Angelakisella sp.]